MHHAPVVFRVNVHHGTCLGGAVGLEEGDELVELDDELPGMFVDPRVVVAGSRLRDDALNVGGVFSSMIVLY